jgi:hypothetical protein
MLESSKQNFSARERVRILQAERNFPSHRFVSPSSISPIKSRIAQRLALPAAPLISENRRIKYKPCIREATQRVKDTEGFNLDGGYEHYGSSDGAWRDFEVRGKRIILPPGAMPRRSKRFQKHDLTA